MKVHKVGDCLDNDGRVLEMHLHGEPTSEPKCMTKTFIWWSLITVCTLHVTVKAQSFQYLKNKSGLEAETERWELYSNSWNVKSSQYVQCASLSNVNRVRVQTASKFITCSLIHHCRTLRQTAKQCVSPNATISMSLAFDVDILFINQKSIHFTQSEFGFFFYTCVLCLKRH